MKTVLVLEDEPIVMNVFCLALVRAGYKVLEAATAADALQRSMESSGRIDLLLADVELPVSSGIRVALQLKQSIPALKIILTSGYPLGMSGDQDSAELGEFPAGCVLFLQKPFTSAILLDSVGELIGPPTETLPNHMVAEAR